MLTPYRGVVLEDVPAVSDQLRHDHNGHQDDHNNKQLGVGVGGSHIPVPGNGELFGELGVDIQKEATAESEKSSRACPTRKASDVQRRGDKERNGVCLIQWAHTRPLIW